MCIRDRHYYRSQLWIRAPVPHHLTFFSTYNTLLLVTINLLFFWIGAISHHSFASWHEPIPANPGRRLCSDLITWLFSFIHSILLKPSLSFLSLSLSLSPARILTHYVRERSVSSLRLISFTAHINTINIVHSKNNGIYLQYEANLLDWTTLYSPP